MKKFMKWMNEKFGPALAKVTDNVYIASISDGMMLVVPLILIGAFVYITVILRGYIPAIPDLTAIQNYSFGLFGILAAFGIAYRFMERKNCHESKVAAGLMAVGIYFMATMPIFDESGLMVLDFSRMGASGIFVSVVMGLFTGTVMSFFEEKQFFSKGGTFPQFITNWFDVMAAAVVIYLPVWIFTTALQIDVYAVIASWFDPLSTLGQSYLGFVLITGISIFLYSFGLSAWTLFAIMNPIMLAGTAENVELAAKGMAAVNINTWETGIAWVWLGGMGMTFMLNMLFLRSKSKRLKTLGRATLLPTIMNINEPIVFGAPIAWNPILMIPFIICGFLVPAIVYPVLQGGLVTIPSQPFQLWFLPIGITTYIVNQDWRGLVLLAVLLAITGAIYYPFFKIYEKQLVGKEEQKIKED